MLLKHYTTKQSLIQTHSSDQEVSHKFYILVFTFFNFAILVTNFCIFWNWTQQLNEGRACWSLQYKANSISCLIKIGIPGYVKTLVLSGHLHGGRIAAPPPPIAGAVSLSTVRKSQIFTLSFTFHPILTFCIRIDNHDLLSVHWNYFTFRN